MLEDKTHNNIMLDLINGVDSDVNTGEGTLIHHSFAGAATEFEQAYINLRVIDQNGSAETADREHLILRAKEQGIIPLEKTNAIWKAVFNIDVNINSRFSAGKMTYKCIEKMGSLTYRLMCETKGVEGNVKQGDLLPIQYINGYENGELIELLTPARDDEETETFRARYFSIISATQAFGGNRTQYKQIMNEMEGVGACKIYRVTSEQRRINIYFLDSQFSTPNTTLVSDIQEIIDPIGKQGEGEGKASIYHVVDLLPCESKLVEIVAKITLDSGYEWEELLPIIQTKLDEYYLELAKGWENTDYITVRILRINSAIASVEGVIDVQETQLNGNEENLILESNEIPIRGELICREI